MRGERSGRGVAGDAEFVDVRDGLRGVGARDLGVAADAEPVDGAAIGEGFAHPCLERLADERDVDLTPRPMPADASVEFPPVPEPTADDLAHQLMPLPPVDEKAAAGDKKPEKTGLALELEKRRKKAPSLVALAALPSGCSRATVLLAPADGETYTSYVIDDDPSKLPPGQLRIHNLSPLEILVRCNGKQQKELKTRESFISPAENQQIIYELAYKAGDEWKMQENNIIPIRDNEQTQMMILKSKNSFFQSTDGSSGGFLQIVTLRRGPSR